MFWRNGYEPLAALDDNHDGWITDAELTGVSVWRDRDSNGVSDVGEVVPASQFGILAIASRPCCTQNGVLMNSMASGCVMDVSCPHLTGYPNHARVLADLHGPPRLLRQQRCGRLILYGKDPVTPPPLPRLQRRRARSSRAFVRLRSRDRPGRRPRILLRSSWQSVNIGDIGHTPGALSLIEKYFPEAEITLWPGELGHGSREMLTQGYPRLKIVEGSLDQENRPATPALAKAWEEADLYLSGSGSGFPASDHAVAFSKGHRQTRRRLRRQHRPDLRHRRRPRSRGRHAGGDSREARSGCRRRTSPPICATSWIARRSSSAATPSRATTSRRRA